MTEVMRKMDFGSTVVKRKLDVYSRADGKRWKPLEAAKFKDHHNGAAVDVVQMFSSDKDLRAAFLKSRFADTILKATQKVDSIRQDRERLEREKQREKVRIFDAEIRASRKTSEQNDLKMKREKDRVAARMAIQEMEKTVEIYDTTSIINDVEMLCFGSQRGRILEQLGLFFKVDYLKEDLDAVLNAEEGEILS